MHLNDRTFCEDEQDFGYIVAYHEQPDPNLERDPLEMAEQLHTHVQSYLKAQFKEWAQDNTFMTCQETIEFADAALDHIDLSEGEH